LAEGRHERSADARRRRNAIIIGAIVLGLLVFGVGYVLGTSGDETAASTTPTSLPPTSAEPTDPSPTSSSSSSPEPSGDELPDGKYFVQLSDLQGGGDGPFLVHYDLAYFYTDDEANQVAASRGDETPVPNGVYIVNDNPKLRTAPLADGFSVRYIPEGSGSETVPAPQDRFLAWLGDTEQTDFPSKDITYWWITVDGGEVTKIEQQYLP
jgi:hypothetical protein